MDTLKSLVLFCLALGFGLTIGCTSSNSNQNAQANADSLKMADSAKKKIEYPLPTPFEINQMLERAKASYILNLSNPLSNAEKYNTEKAKALNLGIYGSDLSYAVTYKKTQETTKYLEKVQKLTDDLGISTMINKSLVDRVEKNITNADSLHSIVSGSYYDTFNFLNNSGKGAVSSLVLAGGWIEGIYVASQLAITAKKNDEIIKIIASQKVTLDQLLSVLESNKADNAAVSEVITELQKIKAEYKDVDEKGSLSPDQLSKITKAVETLRKSIVG
jgi:hypothetical protein